VDEEEEDENEEESTTDGYDYSSKVKAAPSNPKAG